MKISSIFHTLIFLMAVLTFNMPFTTIAQQNEEEPITIETFVSIDPAEIESPAAGEQFTVSINITRGAGVVGYVATVNFDPTALKYVSAANADYLPVGVFPVVRDGSVLVAAVGATAAAASDGTLATVTFEVVEAKASTISLTDVDLAGADDNLLDFVIADTTTVTTTNVEFPDVNLAIKVREALNLPDGAAIPKAEIATLTEFYAPEASIGDLTGLEFATNLTRLNLRDNNLSDISPVSGLINLTELDLWGNNLSDISPVSGLINLTWLSLTSNNISEISPVSGLINLTVLALGGNNISEISPVSGLTKLTWLDLGINNISEISSVSGLISLTWLGLYFNDLSDISPVSRLTNLTVLSLWGNNLSDISPVSGLTNLTSLDLRDNNLSDISPVSGLTKLTELDLGINNISEISPVSGLINLVRLNLWNNSISDLSPLAANPGLGAGDKVYLETNPLSYTSIYTHIPTLQERGAEVVFDNRLPRRIRIVSGDDQQGLTGVALEKPFVVEVQDENGVAFEGVPVAFAATAGGGKLSPTRAATDSNGRAESTLTLGPTPGTNTVTVSVTGIQEVEIFTADGIRVPKTLQIISGKDQQELPGVALEKPFVVEVRDQADEPLPGAQVTFSVSSGGGTLSATSVTTDNNGQAESTLTLGPKAGTNTVTASVTGITQTETFNAEGIRIPKRLEIVSGGDQEGLPGAALENPFVVEVRDQSDKPLPDVQVAFSVSSGGGTLSATSVTTNSNGRVESRLTLGPNTGTNTVTVSVAGIQAQQTFTAEGIRIPLAFWIISGDKQQGQLGEALAKPFVVEVRDQSGDSLPSVQVTFSVSSGGGTLSVTTATTDNNGRAESILTLGPNLGTNTVTVSVTGIKEKQTVSAFAELPPIPQDATLSLLPSPVQSPAVGEELTLSLNIAGGEGVAGYQATVQFDDTALRYVSSAIGDYLPAGAFPLPPDASSNTVTLGATSFGGESSGDGTLATITFEVIAVKESTLSLSDVLLSDSAGTGRLPRVEDGQITESPQLKGDVNGDGIVNILDLVLVAGRFGQSGQESADVNGDGIVNILDLVLVAGAFGNAAAPASDPQALAMLTTADVEQWLAHAQELDLTDATFQRGILFLEQVLAVLTPKETVLLPNYPNPFNPETWIPYRLSNDTDVRISIYDINGALVRQLDLGHQRAGYYTDRSRAAYWDGRNAFGERVASGIYFYLLTARDFSATRKMLIGK